MIRTVLTIIFIVASVGLVVGYAVPTYQGSADVRSEIASLDTALANARALQAERQKLLDAYSNFERSDVERVETLLPDSINNVKLILELDNVASQHGLAIQNIDVAENDVRTLANNVQNAETPRYRSVDLNFTLVGPYERFVNFLEDAEQSLRLIDVQAVAFQAVDTRNNFQYNVTVRTYWLP